MTRIDKHRSWRVSRPKPERLGLAICVRLAMETHEQDIEALTLSLVKLLVASETELE